MQLCLCVLVSVCLSWLRISWIISSNFLIALILTKLLSMYNHILSLKIEFVDCSLQKADCSLDLKLMIRERAHIT